MSIRPTILLCLALLACCGSALASGLLIPADTDVPPLGLRSHYVSVDINTQGAQTKVVQIFENNTDRQLEARYVFPIPRGAAISRFTMLVNGVEKSGEMVEKNQARAIYNSIVSRAQDPGLLEYIGQDVFRANIFPILPHSTQKIEVSYIEILQREGELIAYTYPMRAGEKRGPEVRNDFKLEVSVKSPTPIKNVYSPSHSVFVARPGDTEARVSFEQLHSRLDRDFQLYYSLGEKDVGLNLVTYRPDSSKPGYFMALISPKIKLRAEEIVQRDFVFVIDNSGSMEGEKMRQACAALKFCVNNLRDGDRFNIVKFSTDVEPWKNDLVEGASARSAALNYIDTIEAEGGTNTWGALQSALAHFKSPDRPFIVMFMTDGKPTIGDTDADAMLNKIQAMQTKLGKSARIFTWGVGYDVDTRFLDRLAELGSGVSEYVKPKEDIAAKVQAFYHKSSSPVLTGLSLEVLTDKIQLVNVYPKKLSDLYAGSQLVVIGQYTGDGPAALRLSGEVNGKTQQFTFESDFARQETKSAFIEPLWAKRRIGNLLDTIRLHGESKELVDDVIRLSREYGIQTPYTSYLVLENGTAVPAQPENSAMPIASADMPHVRGAGGGLRKDALDKASSFAQKASLPDAASKTAPASVSESQSVGGRAFDDGEKRRQEQNEFAKSLSGDFKKFDGDAGITVARYVRDLKSAESSGEQHVGIIKRAGGARFFQVGPLWVDDRFSVDASVTQIKFGSDGYFALLEKHPELNQVFAVGAGLIYITASGKAVVISPIGAEKLSDAQLDALFQK
jgi:Ca-activated chloride channel family protein